MRLIKYLFATLGFSLVAGMAQAANPVAGVDYQILDQARPTEAGAKVEVLEFFWYNCPHCFALEPRVDQWAAKQGDNIVLRRIPIAFNKSFVAQQKLYFTLEAMGRVKDLHPKVFHSIHVERKPLESEAAITEFMVRQGIDRKKFLDTFNSFGVNTKVERATQLRAAYGVNSTPMIAVNGRYITSPAIVGVKMRGQSEKALHDATLDVMSYLVTKAQAEAGKK